jgi:RNA-directed DNA polymerase
MEKTPITHVNDGVVFLGHRIIRKRGPRGPLRPVTTIPWEKYRGFTDKLGKELSGNYSVNSMDLMERLNRTLSGWANFYRYTDYTATVFSRVDRIVFWKLGHWLARKYRRGFPSLMREHVPAPDPGRATPWVLKGQNSRGWYGEQAIRRLATSSKGQFRWRNPEENPCLIRGEHRAFLESRYADVAFAFSNAWMGSRMRR